MRHTVVVTGPPGAGKSAVSERLAKLLSPSACVAGDVFFGFVRNGFLNPWLVEAQNQNRAVIEAAALSVGRMARRFHVVYDGVVGPWYMPAFVNASGLRTVHYAVLLPPLSVCLERITSRANHGFKHLDAAERMWGDFTSSVDGLERHRLDAVADPGTLARHIAGCLSVGSLRFESDGAAMP